MHRLLSLCLGAVLVVACGASDKGGAGGGGTGGSPGDAGNPEESGVCLAPTAAGECGRCNKASCCAEQQACLTDSVCAYAGAAFLECAAADGGPGCYDPFLQNGGANAQKAVDCARMYCQTPCQL